MTLVAYYPLDEDSGSTANDVAGSNDGTINGATVGATGLLGTTCYDFDGTDDLVTADGIAVSGNYFSMAAWIEADAVDGMFFRNATTDPVQIEGSGGNWQIRIFDGSANTNYSASNTGATGVWTMVTGVFNDGDLILYVNGVEEDRNTTGITYDGTLSGNPLSIGARYNNANNFDGRIDEVRIYDHALSPQEVQYLYSASKYGDHVTTKL